MGGKRSLVGPSRLVLHPGCSRRKTTLQQLPKSHRVSFGYDSNDLETKIVYCR